MLTDSGGSCRRSSLKLPWASCRLAAWTSYPSSGSSWKIAESPSRISDRRRRHREEETARAEGLPSTEELVLRNEQRVRVAAAVGELEEPYRSTLMLRFQEGLTPKEIAGRSNVAADTVRFRIRRGTEQLRARLAAEREGGGLLALAAAFPVAKRKSLGALASSSSGVTAGLSALLVVKAVVALVGVLLLAWMASRREADVDVAPMSSDAYALVLPADASTVPVDVQPTLLPEPEGLNAVRAVPPVIGDGDQAIDSPSPRALGRIVLHNPDGGILSGPISGELVGKLNSKLLTRGRTSPDLSLSFDSAVFSLEMVPYKNGAWAPRGWSGKQAARLEGIHPVHWTWHIEGIHLEGLGRAIPVKATAPTEGTGRNSLRFVPEEQELHFKLLAPLSLHVVDANDGRSELTGVNVVVGAFLNGMYPLMRGVELASGETSPVLLEPNFRQGQGEASVSIISAPGYAWKEVYLPLSIGGTRTVELEPDLASVRGTIHVPEGWDLPDMMVAIQRLSPTTGSQYESAYMSLDELELVEGVPGTRAFDAGELAVGEYLVAVPKLHFARNFSVTSAGQENPAFEVPRPVTVTVRIRDAFSGGTARYVESLKWTTPPFRQYSMQIFRGTSRSEETGLFHLRVTAGEVEVGGSSGAYDLPGKVVHAFEGAHFEMEALLRSVIKVRLKDGEKLMPWPPEFKLRLEAVDGPDPEWSSGGSAKSRRFLLSGTGRYRIFLPTIEGYLAPEPIEVDVAEPKTYLVDVPLQKLSD